MCCPYVESAGFPQTKKRKLEVESSGNSDKTENSGSNEPKKKLNKNKETIVQFEYKKRATIHKTKAKKNSKSKNIKNVKKKEYTL